MSIVSFEQLVPELLEQLDDRGHRGSWLSGAGLDDDGLPMAGIGTREVWLVDRADLGRH